MTTDLPAAPPRVAHTTLNAIWAQKPCAGGWQKLLANLGKTEADDEPLSLLTILESNGLEDALWALQRACKGYDREAWRFALACARDVQHLMTDPRSIAALDVAERYAQGGAMGEELAAARADAWAVGDAEWAVGDASRAAAWAVAGDAARSAVSAWDAARAAGAAWDAASERQTAHFIRIFGGSDD